MNQSWWIKPLHILCRNHERPRRPQPDEGICASARQDTPAQRPSHLGPVPAVAGATTLAGMWSLMDRRRPNPCFHQLTFGASNVMSTLGHWMHRRSAVESNACRQACDVSSNSFHTILKFGGLLSIHFKIFRGATIPHFTGSGIGKI